MTFPLILPGIQHFVRQSGFLKPARQGFGIGNGIGAYQYRAPAWADRLYPLDNRLP